MASKRSGGGQGSGHGRQSKRGARKAPEGDSAQLSAYLPASDRKPDQPDTAGERPGASPVDMSAAALQEAWTPETREVMLADLWGRHLSLRRGDGAFYQRVGKALALWVIYIELRDAGASSDQLARASGEAAQAWSDVATGAWGEHSRERRRKQARGH